MSDTAHALDLHRYFEHPEKSVELIESGLAEVTFGEYLVVRRQLTRFQLFRALQMQDRNPGVRIGECAAALGFMSYSDVENHLDAWKTLTVVKG